MAATATPPQPQPQAPPPKGYQMPPAEVGLPVYWYPSGSKADKPHAAFVSGAANRSLSLNILSPTTYNYLLRDGVRHVSDPDAKRVEFQESGAWDYVPWYKAFLDMQKVIETLTK